MFERYLASAIAKHFGHVIEGLEEMAAAPPMTNRIHLSAWNGELVLRDLSLQRNAIATLWPDAPLEIIHSRIGRLEIRVPWHWIRSQFMGATSIRKAATTTTMTVAAAASMRSCSVVLTDVSIVVTPITRTKADSPYEDEDNHHHGDNNDDDDARIRADDSKAIDTERQEATLKALTQRLEEVVQAALESQLLQQHVTFRATNRGKATPSWIQSRIDELLATLSVTVNNVHIRYEDAGRGFMVLNGTALPESSRPPFALGIVLDGFELQAKQRQEKVACLKDLAAYWDSDCHVQLSEMDDRIELEEALHKARTQHDFVLTPCSIQLSLQQLSALSASLEAKLPQVHWHVTKIVLDDIAYLRHAFAVWKSVHSSQIGHHCLQRLARLRPSVSPIINPKQWWLYAFEGVMAFQGHRGRTHGVHHPYHGHQRRRRKGWLGLSQALQLRNHYVALYQEFLASDQECQTYHRRLQQFERELLVEEIVAFRIHVYSIFMQHRLFMVKKPEQDEEDCTSAEHRRNTFLEMVQFLERTVIQASDSTPIQDTDGKPVWTTVLQCPDFFVQINDSHSMSRRDPVARFSCALFQELRIFTNESWEVSVRVGDLNVRNCLVPTSSSFPNLVGPKLGKEESSMFRIENWDYQESVFINVLRMFDGAGNGSDRGYTTTTHVRILPLEVVYSSDCLRALRHVSESANVELAGDYNRLASRFASWRARQKDRLFSALAHKRKNIRVAIDVGAPIILLPDEGGDEHEHPDGLLLAIDLGRLKFTNDDRPRRVDFDDNWKLEVDQVSMFVCTTTQYHTPTTRQSPGQQTLHGLIEPFSLKISIATTIKTGDNPTLFHIVAILPRLAMNVTSSAVRLLRRLMLGFPGRFNGTDARSDLSGSTTRRDHVAGEQVDPCANPISRRRIEFHFVAPLLRIGLENNVDQRYYWKNNKNDQRSSFPLFNVAFRGIEGVVTDSKEAHNSEFVAEAKIRSLVATDLYQHAGDDFCFLLSSVSPHLLTSIFEDGPELSMASNDLVTVHYRSGKGNASLPAVSPDDANMEHICGQLHIRFHELYVEWNPETIASIYQAISLPPELQGISEENSSNRLDDEVESSHDFYDAQEEMYFDADCSGTEEMSRTRSSPMKEFPSTTCHYRIISDHNTQVIAGYAKTIEKSSHGRLRSPFAVTFDMSKLRVNFNKESRHRRAFVAEMDGTSVRYASRVEGGYMFRLRIGNLTLCDPASSDDKTLYREVLGLKNDVRCGKPMSLLEMEYTSNVKSRTLVSNLSSVSRHEIGSSVIVDTHHGSIDGFDNKLEARLSPMRFVYVQQLWFEIIDYFYEGIVGYEVWGNIRPGPLDPTQLERQSTEAGLDSLSFTIFDVTMDSPVIILPVSPCSTDFLRIEMESMIISNSFNRRPMRVLSEKMERDTLLQWYNNCTVSLDNIVLISSKGNELIKNGNLQQSVIRINWPTGPTAALNVPKWKVHVSFDILNLSIQKEDFALFQHIVLYNLGEDSRFMSEWIALNALDPFHREQYMSSVLVHFGYDKKDVAPTTFDIQVSSPCCRVDLNDDGGRCSFVAVIQRLHWGYKKMTDRISRQTLDCDLTLVDGTQGSSKAFFSNQVATGPTKVLLTSETHPSGCNTKCLDIESPQILAAIPAWEKVLNFFQGLPEPSFLSPDEVIQVGDRWYRIGESLKRNSKNSEKIVKMDWLPYFDSTTQCELGTNSVQLTLKSRYNLSFRRPKLVIGDESASIALVADSVDFLNQTGSGLSRRRMDIRNLQILVDTMATKKGSQIIVSSKPWHVNLTSEDGLTQTAGSTLCRSLKFNAGSLHARLCYTDLVVAIGVLEKVWDSAIKPNEHASARTSVMINRGKGSTRIRNDDVEAASDRFHALLEDFSVLIVDDSGRHFANAQELILLKAETIDFRRESRNIEDLPFPEVSRHVRVQSVEIIDCLQAEASPFRSALKVKPFVSEKDCSDHETGLYNHGFELLTLHNGAHAYSMILGFVEFQYNPSMIIALQRLLGRLLKRMSTDAEGSLASNGVGATDDGPALPTTLQSRGTLDVGHFLVSLNKEHQGRQLVRAKVHSLELEMDSSPSGFFVRGSIRTIDSVVPANNAMAESDLLKSTMESQQFLSFVYKTFIKHSGATQPSGLPPWMNDHIIGEPFIDDYLEVAVSPVKFTVHRAHLEELVDYLGNGMPGRGMGLTSRAAKGFVANRIEKRSFLDLAIQSPVIAIPSASSHAKKKCCLVEFGDVRARSWIEQREGSALASRRVKVECGLRLCVADGIKENPLVHRIKVEFHLGRTADAFTVSAIVPDIQVHLSYPDYCAIVDVMRTNMTKPVDRGAWDNLESKWESEELMKGPDNEGSVGHNATNVVYASSARHVRYGQGRLSKAESRNSALCLQLALGSLSLILKRDSDRSGHLSNEILFLRCHGVETSAEGNSDGDLSLCFSIKEVFLFDLCAWDAPLNAKKYDFRRSVAVIVEGYSPPVREGDSDTSAPIDSQLAIKLDRILDTPDLKATFVLSFLSVAPFPRLLTETIEFFSCSWPTENFQREAVPINMVSERNETGGMITQQLHESSRIDIRIVLHYPRFVFVAEERDPHSRALVLQGLAMVNATLNVPSAKSEQYAEVIHTRVNRINADFQQIASFIYPDVSRIITLRPSHDPVLDNLFQRFNILTIPEETDDNEKSEDSAVPLLLPLTMAIEFAQITDVQSAQRSVTVNMEPVSILLGIEDIQLVQSVVGKWSSTSRSYRHEESQAYEVVFESEKLGLGLRKEGGCIVVDSVKDPAATKGVRIGDTIIGIQESTLRNADDIPLSDVVRQLGDGDRPLRLTMSRLINKTNKADNLEAAKPDKDNMVNVDVNFTSAVVTLVEKDFPLARGEIRNAKLGYGVRRTPQLLQRFSLSSTFVLWYYNLSIWTWEPCIEPGKLIFTVEKQLSSEGVGHLTIEVGDGQEGLALNVTNASAETCSKILTWGMLLNNSVNNSAAVGQVFGKLKDESSQQNGVSSISRNAADAALVYAHRQRRGAARPFIFRNRSGLSVAFVQQRYRYGESPPAAKPPSLLGLGEYEGLETFDSTDINVVAHDDEIQFRVEMDGDIPGESIISRASLSLQRIGSVIFHPLHGLQIHRPGEFQVPVYYHIACEDGNYEEHNIFVGKQLASWIIEQVDETTIVTFGSSLRLVSLLRNPVDVSIEVFRSKDASVTERYSVWSLGNTHQFVPFYLPLWLAVEDFWCCSIRLEGDYRASKLFSYSEEGSFDFGPMAGKTVGCYSKKSAVPATWVATHIEEKNGFWTVILDSLISLRNLLPTDVEWEMRDKSLCLIDGSSLRAHSIYMQQDCRIRSGEKVEILSRTMHDLVVKFRPRGFNSWTNWLPLLLSTQSHPKIGKDDGKEETDDNDTRNCVVQHAQILDDFGFAQDIGLRISPKDCGLDLILFAELWFLNCSGFEVVFGCPRTQLTRPPDSLKATSAVTTDVTAAEAALKEISLLFDSGNDAKSQKGDFKSRGSTHFVRIPCQSSSKIVEECFEYLEVINDSKYRRWWATESASDELSDVTKVNDTGTEWYWTDTKWQIDNTGSPSNDGWESAPSLNNFAPDRSFNPVHKYRRRRWFRRRKGLRKDCLVSNVHGFHQPLRNTITRAKEKKHVQRNIRVGFQVNGGQWALSSAIPPHGNAYGAVRAYASRWPETFLCRGAFDGEHGDAGTAVFELCYSISSLDGAWGEFSRLIVVTNRFILRNVSKRYTFEVKQVGVPDMLALKIAPGEAKPFHWSDCRRPELVTIRPLSLSGKYLWSGGFDPLTIGSIPIRVRRQEPPLKSETESTVSIRSIKMEAEVRSKTGGTGINLMFLEEEENGVGSLFRIENRSLFSVWFAQDGLIANPSPEQSYDTQFVGQQLRPSESTCFGLDVPFRQGKYSGRKSATMLELLRVRLGLAPLTTRAGIETTKVMSLATVGAKVKLNPSKLVFLKTQHRSTLDRVRVCGIVHNDGPTTVLTLRMMEKDSDNLLVNPFLADSSTYLTDPDLKRNFAIYEEQMKCAEETFKEKLKRRFPTEDELSSNCFSDNAEPAAIHPGPSERENSEANDFQISLRLSLRGVVISLVDASPNEIAVITMKNINSISSWNLHRTNDATVFITVADVQVDNMIPNAPFPVAICSDKKVSQSEDVLNSDSDLAPMLVLGLSLAPRHLSGTVCLKSVTVAPSNIAIRVDLAFIVRLQKFFLDLQAFFANREDIPDEMWPLPDLARRIYWHQEALLFNMNSQKVFFGGLTILPCNIRLSVAPARALTTQQAAQEGADNAALHQAVRKGDVRIARGNEGVLGVNVGRTNKTAISVVRGMLKSFVVDALLRLDGASINLAGLSLRNHTSTFGQLSTYIGAHYLTSLRLNVPALVGSLAAIGNPIGLVRGLGDGVSDFVLEPVKGLQRSVQEMDASHLVDGVARGTLSLARHTVGGFADSAAMLTETFSKNMVVLTLDRRYAQKRDRGDMLRDHGDVNVAIGIGSGIHKLVTGFLEGVTGVVQAPIRGAEKKGLEGFAKGIGKGLLGLLVKPIIGISDGISDVFIGVKGSVEGATGVQQQLVHIRPRRALYGRERVLRQYNIADAAAAALLMRTRLAGESYFAHLDMGDRLALLSVKRLLIIGSSGEELLLVRFRHIESIEVMSTPRKDGKIVWNVVLVLNTPRQNGSDVEVITCHEEIEAKELCRLMQEGIKLRGSDMARVESAGMYLSRS